MNVPEIRFKGFTDAWVQRKLGEVAEFNPRSVLPDSFEYVDLESVVGTSLVSHRTENKDTAPSRAQRLAKKGDVFFQLVRPYQQNNYLFDLLFKNFVFSTGYAQLRPNIDSHFLLCLLQEKQFVAKVLDNCTGTSYPAINSNVLADIYINVTVDINEQATIGSFFRTLDHTITLHQRKLDGLRELKKGYLQQMFPQAGEKVPRIRFKGFSGDWQERKLGKISMKISDKNKKNQFTETFTNSAEYGIISQREFFDKDISNLKNLDGYFIVCPDDFVYNPRISNFAPVGPIKRNLLGRTGVMSPLYYVFRIIDGDCTFIEKYFESVYWHEFMNMNGDNGVRADRFNIKDNIFEEMPIPFPNITEQVAIGNFFQNLDSQITAQKTKLAQMKKLKSAYLQKMFI